MPEEPQIFNHKASGDFWSCYGELTPALQELADKNFQLLKDDPRHPSLRFKRVGKVWSARVGINHRAIATPIPDGFLWVWIGSHKEYDQLIKSL